MTIGTYFILATLAIIGAGHSSAEESIREDIVVTRHDNIVKSVAISPDGRLIASAGFDGKVTVRQTDNLDASSTVIDLGDLLSTVDFSKNGKYIFSGGNYNRYKIANICIETSKTEDIDPKASGTIVLAHEIPDSRLIIVSADNRITSYSLSASRQIHSADIFGGFLGCISISDDSAFVAISSQNEINNRGADPCKMTIFDTRCEPAFSYQYKSSNDYRQSQHAFSTNGGLYLITPRQLMKFTLDAAKRKWELSATITRQSVGFNQPSDMAVAGDPARIWIADGRHVHEIDPNTLKVVNEHKFQVGPKIGTYATAVINSIAVNLETGVLAAGCQDGTVRISYLPINERQQDAPSDDTRLRR